MTDSLTPPVLISDPNRGFRYWHISEIYVPGGNGRYVPNVDDAVMDWDQGILRVIAVDFSTGIATLDRWTPARDSSELTDHDILIGAGPGNIADSYRVYLDTSVMPHTLAVDSRMRIYGSTSRSIKIFLGSTIGENGTVISAFYDQNGNFLGENIPLELVGTRQEVTQGIDPIFGGTVADPLITNSAIKAPMVGYTNRSLPDGEVVTVVVYDDAGGVISHARMLIRNTNFARSNDASLKYVRSIALTSPFFSATDPMLLEYPVNMPVEALNLMGVVTYSDGKKLTLPVDGTKFELHGLDNYIATIQGQKLPLVLTYKLSAGEYSYVNDPSPNGHISEAYFATTKAADGAYTIKLFAYPVWIDALNGYRLEYFLYNLDRSDVYNVTNLVQMASGSRAFDPIGFGIEQKIAVALDLNRVDPRFAAYRHVQTFQISLLANGNDTTVDNWTVGFSPGQTPAYGAGLKAVASFINTNNWTYDVSCGLSSLEEWLEKVFYATHPLYDAETELRAPAPNYFALVAGNHREEFPIAQWNSVLTMHDASAIGKPTYIEFIRRIPSNDLQLGISALVTHHSA